MFSHTRHTPPWITALLTGLAAALVLLAASSARADAATLTVTTSADSNDGGCASVCSLRDAIITADKAGGATTITVPAGTYTLSIANPPTLQQAPDPTVGDLDVTNGAAITLTGAGAGQTIINAAHIDRAFYVDGGASLAISGVTITGGEQSSGTRTSTVLGSLSLDPGYGGAIDNDGTLTVNASEFDHDTANNAGGAIDASGRAASTTVTDSVLEADATPGTGGAINVQSGPLTLTRDTISGDSAETQGGAVAMSSPAGAPAPFSLTGSTVTDDFADDNGGAIQLFQIATATITGSQISGDNSGDDSGGGVTDTSSGLLKVASTTFDRDFAGDDAGGALLTDGTDLTVTGSTFSNSSSEFGGAVYVAGSTADAASSITGSTFTGNHGDDGGAIEHEQGDLTLSADTFSGNSGDVGGAIEESSKDGLTLVNSTLDGNHAAFGGGLYIEAPSQHTPISLRNDTIARNVAEFGGGIAYPYDANAIENTIVAGNTGSPDDAGNGGGDCYFAADNTANMSDADAGYNLDSDGSCFGAAGDGAQGNLTRVDPKLAPLAANGGPVATDALLAGSPAIGTALASGCPGTDARGVTRGGACDIGAYQAAPADLAVTASGPASAGVGQPITDTFTVTNSGPGGAGGVTFTDRLPSGTAFFAASSTQGSCSGTSTVTCTLGALDSSQTGAPGSATVTVVLIGNAPGAAANTGSVAATQSDPASGNNTATATTNVTAPAGAGGSATTQTPVAPVVLTGKASELTAHGAAVSALINPAGSATTYAFQYGTSRALGHASATKRLAAGRLQQGVSATLKGLKAGRRYFYRVAATNAAGTTDGPLETFKTKAAPKHRKKPGHRRRPHRRR